MSISTRITRVILCTNLMLVIVLLCVFQFILGNDFEAIEKQELRDNLERVDQAFSSTQQRLLMSNRDWSKWDDTYQYMKERDDSFFESVVTYDYVKSLLVQHIAFMDLQGKVVKGFSVDTEAEEIKDLAPEVLEKLKAGGPITTPTDLNDTSAVTAIGDQAYIIASTTIQDSEISLPSRGVLVFFQPIDEEFVSALGKTVNLPLQFYKANTIADSNSTEVFSQIRNTLNAGKASNIYTMNDHLAAGLSLVKSPRGKLLGAFRFTAHRAVFQQGKVTRAWVICCLIIAGLGSTLFTLRLLRRHVIERLTNLSADLSTIATASDPSQRVVPTGNDELTTVALNTNSLLSALEESQSKLGDALLVAEDASRAKSAFLAKVSHGLRTPIHSMDGLLRILLSAEQSPVKRTHIKSARKAGSNLLATINEILDFSKAESGNLTLEETDFSLRGLLREVVPLLGSRIDPKQPVELICELDPFVPDKVIGDPTRLRQIIVNLVGNALKFTAQGSVTVRLKTISSTPAWAEVRLEVEDTGIGIPNDKLSSIFSPFTQADDSIARVYHGTGLGLSIVRQIAELMLADISVTSEVGKGSVFALQFKLDLIDGEIWNPPLAHSGEQVAIIDGNSCESQSLRDALEMRGFQVKSIQGKETSAISDLASRITQFSFVIVMLEDQLRSSVFNILAESVSNRSTTMVAVVPSGDLQERERLLTLGVPFVPARPIIVDDIILAIRGQLTLEAPMEDDTDSAQYMQTRKLRILVADDTATNRLILEHMLTDAGHDVVTVKNGVEMIQAIEPWLHDTLGAEAFDLVLSDVQMPVMDGLTATRKIREMESSLNNGKHVPIVAVTAHAFQEEREGMFASGVDDIVTKPIEPKQLGIVMKRLAGNTGGTIARAHVTIIETDQDLKELATRMWAQMRNEGSIGDLFGASEDLDIAQWIPEGMVECDDVLGVIDVYNRSGDSSRRTKLIFDAFLSSFRDPIAELGNARREGNHDKLRKATHMLRGLLLDVGARSAGNLAGTMEKMCNAGNADRAMKFVPIITCQTLTVARLLERIARNIESAEKATTSENQIQL